jgi:mannose-6-phosphate isomerase-like protein (cupin superfamily)
MLPPVKVWSRAEMLQRVARFGDLKGFSDGLQDSAVPECQKTVYNVLGFQTPETAGKGGVNSPVGKTASENAAIKISEGFNLGFVKTRPGKGVLMHNHDTNETFISMTGTWRASWEDPRGKVEFVDLEPLDVISFPAGVIRRFENVTRGSKTKYSTLMFVIAGDAPAAEFSREAMAVLEEAGLLDGKLRKRAKTVSTASAAPAAKAAKPAKVTAAGAKASAKTAKKPAAKAKAKPAAKAKTRKAA